MHCHGRVLAALTIKEDALQSDLKHLHINGSMFMAINGETLINENLEIPRCSLFLNTSLYDTQKGSTGWVFSQVLNLVVRRCHSSSTVSLWNSHLSSHIPSNYQHNIYFQSGKPPVGLKL